MNLDELQEKPEQKSMAQLAVTQNVIRNKFKKAFIKRIDREHDVNQVVKPFTSNPASSSTSYDMDMQGQHQQSTAVEINFWRMIDPNELCNRLRTLLASTNTFDAKHTEEINAIIRTLRELEILL